MISIYLPITLIGKSINSFEIPITWQIPTVILLTLIFNRKVVLMAFSIYIILGLFILPVFHEGGSIGYLLTPNFGYLLGTYPLIKIIDNLNKNNKINIWSFLKNGFLAICAMHLMGILYNLIQLILYNQLNLFFFNLGKYSSGKIGYHLLMLFPMMLLIKPIKYFKYYKND
jgi:biotin transport system substrate-specific component